jgi:hypothetical protein
MECQRYIDLCCKTIRDGLRDWVCQLQLVRAHIDSEGPIVKEFIKAGAEYAFRQTPSSALICLALNGHILTGAENGLAICTRGPFTSERKTERQNPQMIVLMEGSDGDLIAGTY